MRTTPAKMSAAVNGLPPTLPRYERPLEVAPPPEAMRAGDRISADNAAAAITVSSLSDGGKQLLRGLLRVGTTAVFPGGGVGLEYGGLLKTASRPEYVGTHVAEAAAHLRQRRVDLLLVPGMSGYPIGAMYSVVAGIPAVLLKKAKLDELGRQPYPDGAFVIPSYTGEGDVVMSADPAAVDDIVDDVVRAQLAAQADLAAPELTLRVGGADDIIDKATMSQAVGESAFVIGGSALARSLARHRRVTGDRRPIMTHVAVVAWVTPLIKGYNRPREHLRRMFQIEPFVGINVTSVHLTPPAIGVEGVGVLEFAPSRDVSTCSGQRTPGVFP